MGDRYSTLRHGYACSGATPNEVVLEALRLLSERDRADYERRLEELRIGDRDRD